MPNESSDSAEEQQTESDGPCRGLTAPKLQSLADLLNLSPVPLPPTAKLYNNRTDTQF